MARTKEERTLKMRQDYVALRSAGMLPAEIADEFALSRTTVYRSLDDIAKEAGVERESLLQVPHCPHVSPNRATQTKLEPLDLTNYRADRKETIAKMGALIARIDEDLEKQLEVIEEYEGEE